MSELQKDRFCNPMYERAVLSYCFQSINNFYIVSSKLSAADFLLPEHNMLFMLFAQLVKRKVEKLDSVMVISEAEHNGVLQQVGGYQYINAIVSMDLSDVNIEYYIKKVLDNSTKLKLYQQLSHNLTVTYESGQDEDTTSFELLGSVIKDMMDLSMYSNAVQEAIDLSDGLEAYIEDRRNNPIEYCGISTGHSILDKRIDGLVPGTLHVICARPKEGKSTFLSSVAKHVAYISKMPVLYIDTEMPFDQWRTRMISMISGVPERKVKHGGYTEQEYYNISQAVKLIKSGKCYHEYMPGYSVDKIVAIYKKYKHIHNIGLAIFDYIKEPASSDKNRKEYQILGDVTTALKDLAGELQVPFLCANQVNREGDIADSDRILRYADVLMFFKKKKLAEVQQEGLGAGTYRLIIRDSRRGGTTPNEGIGYNFRKSTLQISEAEVQVINYENKEHHEEEDIEFNKDGGIEGFNDDDSGI